MKKVIVIVGLLLFYGVLNSGNAKYYAEKNLTTSVIIPCCAKHAPCLFSLLKTYETQTLLPDEVVISLSESDEVPKEVLEALHNEPWCFPVFLFLSTEKLYAGQNRNRACEHARGDIFICQDADDIPHPQRVEIIKYFFEHYKVDFLIHQFVFGRRAMESITCQYYNHINKIPFFYNSAITMAWNKGEPLSPGNPAMARYVFDKVKWSAQPRQQDLIFNENVYKLFNNCFALKVPLLVYRQFLSSLSKDSALGNRLQVVVPGVINNRNKKQYAATIEYY